MNLDTHAHSTLPTHAPIPTTVPTMPLPPAIHPSVRPNETPAAPKSIKPMCGSSSAQETTVLASSRLPTSPTVAEMINNQRFDLVCVPPSDSHPPSSGSGPLVHPNQNTTTSSAYTPTALWTPPVSETGSTTDSSPPRVRAIRNEI